MTEPLFPASSQELLVEPTSVFSRCMHALQDVYRRAWSDASEPGALTVPSDVLQRYSKIDQFKTEFSAFKRKWGIEPRTHRRPKPRARRVPLNDVPNGELLQLARIPNFIVTVEALMGHFYERLHPWFAVFPRELIWISSHCGAPRVHDMGPWLSTAGWTVDDVLDDAGFSIDFAFAGDVPAFWTDAVAHAIKWEIASLRQLRVSSTYWPPRALIDQPFASLPNPFIPLIDIWRCGTMLDAPLVDGAPTIFYVRAEALCA